MPEKRYKLRNPTREELTLLQSAIAGAAGMCLYLWLLSPHVDKAGEKAAAVLGMVGGVLGWLAARWYKTKQ